MTKLDLTREALGFYGFRFGRAEDYPLVRVLEPSIPPGSPVFVARKRMDAPYPDVEFVIPVNPSAMAAYVAGDRSVLTTLCEELVVQYGRFRREHGIR